ncbi:PilZ domain-containing protein [Sphingopyxis sp. R3-92]|uniref:PilZ domain-containing protein n=1 Tax=Sphingopyxis sp. R3-92 TaxID=3158553 RepID=UPI003EE739C3
MRSLLAHIADPVEATDRRRTERRTLRLDVAAQSSTEESAVIIRDLSRTGLLIETDTSFTVGETFLLVLPELGATPARIIRADGKRFGCEFLSPVPASAISAALLKAPPVGDVGEIAEPAIQGEDDDVDFRRPTSAILFTVLTTLFTAAAILFVFALVSLNFS